ncbi:MAG TPA: hypothetical protein VMG38_24090 [Trebonia sp.]|nr:hypothetical protein [Trebonia sp.]
MSLRVFKWVGLPFLILLFLVPACLDVGAAWAAKLGQGVQGTFTATVCEPEKTGCFWIGNFVSSNGGDQRNGVGMNDTGITAVGQQAPAVDTGDRVDVYPAGGGGDFAGDTVFLVLALTALGIWITMVPVKAARRRSAARAG